MMFEINVWFLIISWGALLAINMVLAFCLLRYIKKATNAQIVCAQSYQAAGVVLNFTDLFDTEGGMRLLDHLWAGADGVPITHDLLPFQVELLQPPILEAVQNET